MNSLNDLSPEAKQRFLELRSHPLTFAETFLKSPNPGPPYGAFKANYAQRVVLSSTARDTWVCVSRRTGKTFGFTLIALWHAVTREYCQIHVFAPSSVQVEEFFKSIDAWIAANPLLTQFKSGGTKTPQSRTFITGSKIEGHILGVNSAPPDKLRGITADVIIVDEGQGLSDADWTVIIPIMRGDITRRKRIRCYIAGTLNRAAGLYWKKIDKDPVKKNEKIIKIPITENADYTPEMVEEERAAVPAHTWKTEYLLEVSEAETSVFKNVDIDRVFANDWYPSEKALHPYNPIFLTVDWDKVQNGTSLLVTQYDPTTEILDYVYHETIPKGEWTYSIAVARIFELYELFLPTRVVVDQGASEKQWEDLRLGAMKRPELGLLEKLDRVAFQSNITVPDLETGDDVKKKIKPYLVELLVGKTQEGKLRIPAHVEEIREQFVDYKVVERTGLTTKYTNINEHFIDCFLFAMWAVFYFFENPYENRNAGYNEMGVVGVAGEDNYNNKRKQFEKDDTIEEFNWYDRSLDSGSSYNRGAI